MPRDRGRHRRTDGVFGERGADADRSEEAARKAGLAARSAAAGDADIDSSLDAVASCRHHDAAGRQRTGSFRCRPTLTIICSAPARALTKRCNPRAARGSPRLSGLNRCFDWLEPVVTVFDRDELHAAPPGSLSPTREARRRSAMGRFRTRPASSPVDGTVPRLVGLVAAILATGSTRLCGPSRLPARHEGAHHVPPRAFRRAGMMCHTMMSLAVLARWSGAIDWPTCRRQRHGSARSSPGWRC